MRAFCSVLALSLLAAAGCGAAKKPGFPVHGRLLENGQPLVAAADGLPPGVRPIQMSFTAAGGPGPGEQFPCDVNPATGEFTVKPSYGAAGLAAGRYRIQVAVLAPPGLLRGPSGTAGRTPPGRAAYALPPGPGGPGALGLPDRLRGAFGNATSRLVVDITGPADLTVDVGARPGVVVK